MINRIKSLFSRLKACVRGDIIQPVYKIPSDILGPKTLQALVSVWTFNNSGQLVTSSLFRATSSQHADEDSISVFQWNASLKYSMSDLWPLTLQGYKMDDLLTSYISQMLTTMTKQRTSRGSSKWADGCGRSMLRVLWSGCDVSSLVVNCDALTQAFPLHWRFLY